jgi:hypothetical protein
MRLTRSALRITTVVLLALTLGASAFIAQGWAATSEPQQGAQIASEVQTGKLSGSSLSPMQYQRVGQYLMSRAVGSTQAYEAMDSLMDRMMGQSISDQMYLYMGQRFLGKNVPPNASYGQYYGWMANMMSRYGGSYAGMMGAYMMGAYRGLSGSAPYGGMMGGSLAGQTGSGSTARTYPVGPGMMGHRYSANGSSSGGWSTGAIIAVALLGALLIGGAIAFAWPRIHRRQRRPGKASTAAQ